MDELRLVEPTEAYAEDIRVFQEELRAARESYDGCARLEKYDDPLEWIERVRRNSDAATVEPGLVPASVYLAVRGSDGKIVGVTDLRHHIDHPILSTWGGHIGYTVRPCERRKGYAREMLRLNLIKARARGIRRVLITCNDHNPGSERTILANGGVLENIIQDHGENIKRYWIELV